VNRILDVGSSILASIARVGTGAQVGSAGARPQELITLYDFESCPFCRKAREALSILDLDALILPCPKGGPRYREELIRRGGKAQFPYLVDPNSGKEMYESDEIVAYLFEQYGDGGVPWTLSVPVITDVTAMLASIARPTTGRVYRPARAPDEPLELYSFEASPFCRIVREELTTLELPYRLRNVAKGSRRRDAFGDRSGRLMVPFLIDSNTETEMFESADIVRYLRETYAEA
jgi:glutathione S-transferase